MYTYSFTRCVSRPQIKGESHTPDVSGMDMFFLSAAQHWKYEELTKSEQA